MINARIVLFSFTVALLSISAVAQNSMLWRVSGHGLAKPSYLFGAIDLICADDYLWTKSMQECYNQSDKVCFNLNIGDPDFKQKALALVKNSNNKKLEDYFTPENYPNVVRYVKNNLNLDLSKYQAFNPLVIQSALVKKLLGCPDAVSYEKRISENAQVDGKETLGLETIDEMKDMLDATHFCQMIATALTDIANGKTFYQEYRTKVVKAYKQQDIQQISTLFKTSPVFTPADFKILLNDNNARWVSRMPAMMQQSSVFFAFNPINLWGDNGVINLLRKSGYTVEPVN